MKIKTYKNVQTGPNSQDGGDQEGFLSCEYQEYLLINLMFVTNIKNEISQTEHRKCSAFFLFQKNILAWQSKAGDNLVKISQLRQNDQTLQNKNIATTRI